MALSISTLRLSSEIPRSGRAQIVLPHAAGARILVQFNYSSYLVVKGSELPSKTPNPKLQREREINKTKEITYKKKLEGQTC